MFIFFFSFILGMTLAWTFTGKPVGGEAFPFLFFQLRMFLMKDFFSFLSIGTCQLLGNGR
jgi:hypothetical protein